MADFTMGNAYALVVGIADYAKARRLPKVDDAKEVGELLVHPSFCGFPQAQVRLLLDEAASLEALKQGLLWLAETSNSESTVLIYFSGHGERIESGPHAGEYLLPVDADDADEESLARTSLSGVDFSAALRAIKAKKVVVIFDCCHAGGAGDPGAGAQRSALRRRTDGLSEKYYDGLAAGRGRVIYAACRSSEVSWVLPGARYGLFTQHLLDGLRGGVVSEDGLVRIFDLFEYVQPRVTRDKPNQHPVFKAEVEENFPIAQCPGGKKSEIKKDADGFRYDAFVSYVDRDPDSTWVWSVLVPRLEQAGLRVAVAGDVEEAGVARVVSIERGIKQSKRTLVVLSDAYLEDSMADFQSVLAQSLGIAESSARLLPITYAPFRSESLPVRLSMLTTLNLSHPQRAEREFERLIKALRGPLPRQ
jgi:hypothetical protein